MPCETCLPLAGIIALVVRDALLNGDEGDMTWLEALFNVRANRVKRYGIELGRELNSRLLALPPCSLGFIAHQQKEACMFARALLSSFGRVGGYQSTASDCWTEQNEVMWR